MVKKIYVISAGKLRPVPFRIEGQLRDTLKNTVILSKSFRDLEGCAHQLGTAYAAIFIYEADYEEDNRGIIDELRRYNMDLPLLIVDFKGMDMLSVENYLSLGKLGIINGFIQFRKFLGYINKLAQKEWLSADYLWKRLTDYVLEAQNPNELLHLTQKELAVIDAARLGYSIKETAEALTLCHNTVIAYRSRILRKTGASSMTQLVHHLWLLDDRAESQYYSLPQ